MSALRTATVDFRNGTVVIHDGEMNHTTYYEGRDAFKNMVVRLYYLNKARIPTKVVNPIDNLVEKVQAVAKAIAEQEFASLPSKFKTFNI